MCVYVYVLHKGNLRSTWVWKKRYRSHLNVHSPCGITVVWTDPCKRVFSSVKFSLWITVVSDRRSTACHHCTIKLDYMYQCQTTEMQHKPFTCSTQGSDWTEVHCKVKPHWIYRWMNDSELVLNGSSASPLIVKGVTLSYAESFIKFIICASIVRLCVLNSWHDWCK